MQCPKCPFVVWSYSMRDHFNEKHPKVLMPADLEIAVGLRFHEREGTLQLLNKVPKKVSISCTGSHCKCKTQQNE